MSWRPLTEGRNGFFTNSILAEIGSKYGKSIVQIALRWLIQRGVIIIPKSIHIERMQQNTDISNFELTDKDDWAWDIIHGIEELEPSKEIEMLIEDLANRNYEVPEKLLYNSLWYAQANVLENRETLIDVISKSANVKQIVNYLVPLNKGRNRDADLNIQSVIDEVNAGMKKPKP